MQFSSRDLEGRQFRDVLYLGSAEDRRLFPLAENINNSPSMGRLPHDFVYDTQKALLLPVELHYFIRVKFTHWRHYPSEPALTSCKITSLARFRADA